MTINARIICTSHNNIRSSKKKSLFRLIFLYLVLLGLEFDIRFSGFFTLRKVAFLAALLYIFIHGIPANLPIKKSHAVWGMASCILVLYTAFIQHIRSETTAILGNSSYSVFNIISQTLFIFLFPIILSRIFQNANEFFHVQLGIITLQSAVAIISRVCKPFRIFVFQHFSYQERMAHHMESGLRVCILGGSGATASWILFIGCVICAYYILSTRKTRYLMLYGMIMLAMMFVGRTGLYLAILLMAVLLLYAVYKYASLAGKILCAGLLLLILIAVYILYAPENYLKDRTIIWVGEIFFKGVGEGSTVEAIRNMPVPPLNWETLWGTGIISGVTKSGLNIQHDMGYIQTYSALGLFGALFYYLWTFGFFAYEIHEIREKRIRAILWAFLIFMMIAEWKEPFLRKTPNAMALMTAVMIRQKDERLLERSAHDNKPPSSFRYMSQLQP